MPTAHCPKGREDVHRKVIFLGGREAPRATRPWRAPTAVRHAGQPPSGGHHDRSSVLWAGCRGGVHRRYCARSCPSTRGGAWVWPRRAELVRRSRLCALPRGRVFGPGRFPKLVPRPAWRLLVRGWAARYDPGDQRLETGACRALGIVSGLDPPAQPVARPRGQPCSDEVRGSR